MMFQAELLFRIFIGAICGACIGFERMSHFKSAGVKTHMIVGLSSALIMIVSKYGFTDVGKFDAARVAAQVVSGIGFLGAGIIFKKNMNVQGLTTAAGILATSGVGLALGAGMYFIGILGTATYVILCIVVQNIEKFQNGIQESYSIHVIHQDDLIQVLNCCKDLKIITYAVHFENKQDIRLDTTLIFSSKEQKSKWENLVLSLKNVFKFEKY